MKKNQIFHLMVVCTALFFTTMGCNSPTADTAKKMVETSKQAVAKPDLVAIKAEIQAVENAWATAAMAKDAATDRKSVV